MSQRISIGNAEDKILKQKMIEESEAAQKKESKNAITFSEADSERGKMVAVAEPKLHKESKVMKCSIQSKDLFILKLDSNTAKCEYSNSSKNTITETFI